MKAIRISILIFTIILFANVAIAENYPCRPVKVIVPFSEGSATDIIARQLSNELAKIWGQPVTCENIPGRGGTIGAGIIAKAPSDGYTLFIHGAFTINPFFYENLPYEPLKDFTDIAPLAKQPLALVVSPTSNIKSVSALIAEAKANPGQLKYGSPGTGSAAHLTAEKFKIMAGVRVDHLPFKGGPETVAATNSGQVVFSFLPFAFAQKSAESGQLIILGVTSIQRTNLMPEVPTIAEEGLANFEYNHWWGLWAPAKLAAHVLGKIEKDVARALNAPELQKKFANIGAEPFIMNSSEFTKFVRSEMHSVENIAKEAGVKPE